MSSSLSLTAIEAEFVDDVDNSQKESQPSRDGLVIVVGFALLIVRALLLHWARTSHPSCLSISEIEARVFDRYPELLVGAHVLQNMTIMIDQRSKQVALCQ